MPSPQRNSTHRDVPKHYHCSLLFPCPFQNQVGLRGPIYGYQLFDIWHFATLGCEINEFGQTGFADLALQFSIVVMLSAPDDCFLNLYIDPFFQTFEVGGSACSFAFAGIEYIVLIIHSIYIANFARMLDSFLFLVLEGSFFPTALLICSKFGDSIKVLPHKKLHFPQLHLHSRYQMLAETAYPHIKLNIFILFQRLVLADEKVSILDRFTLACLEGRRFLFFGLLILLFVSGWCDYFDLYCKSLQGIQLALGDEFIVLEIMSRLQGIDNFDF